MTEKNNLLEEEASSSKPASECKGWISKNTKHPQIGNGVPVFVLNLCTKEVSAYPHSTDADLCLGLPRNTCINISRNIHKIYAPQENDLLYIRQANERNGYYEEVIISPLGSYLPAVGVADEIRNEYQSCYHDYNSHIKNIKEKSSIVPILKSEAANASVKLCSNGIVDESDKNDNATLPLIYSSAPRSPLTNRLSCSLQRNDEYTIQNILDVKETDKYGRFFLVSWLDYPESANNYEPECHVCNLVSHILAAEKRAEWLNEKKKRLLINSDLSNPILKAKRVICSLAYPGTGSLPSDISGLCSYQIEWEPIPPGIAGNGDDITFPLTSWETESDLCKVSQHLKVLEDFKAHASKKIIASKKRKRKNRKGKGHGKTSYRDKSMVELGYSFGVPEPDDDYYINGYKMKTTYCQHCRAVLPETVVMSSLKVKGAMYCNDCSLPCQICGKDDEDDALLCENTSCGRAWHMKCLKRLEKKDNEGQKSWLYRVRDHSWYCPDCKCNELKEGKYVLAKKDGFYQMGVIGNKQMKRSRRSHLQTRRVDFQNFTEKFSVFDLEILTEDLCEGQPVFIRQKNHAIIPGIIVGIPKRSTWVTKYHGDRLHPIKYFVLLVQVEENEKIVYDVDVQKVNRESIMIQNIISANDKRLLFQQHITSQSILEMFKNQGYKILVKAPKLDNMYIERAIRLLEYKIKKESTAENRILLGETPNCIVPTDSTQNSPSKLLFCNTNKSKSISCISDDAILKQREGIPIRIFRPNTINGVTMEIAEEEYVCGSCCLVFDSSRSLSLHFRSDFHNNIVKDLCETPDEGVLDLLNPTDIHHGTKYTNLAQEKFEEHVFIAEDAEQHWLNYIASKGQQIGEEIQVVSSKHESDR